MLRNYLKIAWRNLLRNKAFSFINISGLGLGIACSLLIMLWITDEKNVDGFHKNSSQLFQVYERSLYDGKTDAGYATQGLLASELKKSFPEIQHAAGFEYVAAPGTQSTFEAGNKLNKMTGFFAGADFFQMFSYPLIQGSVSNALTEPASIAISRKMAEFYFGDVTRAMGQTLRFENKEDLRVTAVFEDVPANSSQRFDFLRNWSDFVRDNQWVNNWGNTSPSTYVQLKPGANAAAVESKIKDFIYRYQEKQSGFRMELALQPYAEKYLHSSFKEGRPEGGRTTYINLFTIIAIFILLIACINFMNLATAQSAKRAKEVGLRKVVGAMRNSLVYQFIGEALLFTLLAVIVALFLSAMLLPAFNALTGKQLSLPITNLYFWLAIALLMLGTGIVAGSYPAIFLSSLKPVKVLKGTLKFSGGATFFRKGLVVFQFSLSLILITAVIVIYKQMDYIQSKNIGYDRENLVYLPIEGELIKKYDLFKKEATQLPGILSISKMRNSPTVIEHHTGSIGWPGKDPNVVVSFADAVVGYDFAKTMKLEIKQGRDFSPEYGADSAAYILNETAVAAMGLTDPIGKIVTWGNRKGTVIGVMKDFHFNSMHQNIDPLIVRLDEKWGWGTILIRTKTGDTRTAIAGLENLSKSLNPKTPFTYRFSDQEFDNLYRSEQVVSKLSNYFAFLAIFISCLGLFGLATFTAAQRTKEIGVRKVLGASVPSIINLLSIGFLKPIFISMLIAIPASYYLVHSWLANFAYKTSVEWWVFAVASLITIVIALITVSYQSIKAALINPAKSLHAD